MPLIQEFIAQNKKLVLLKKLKVRELDEESKGIFIAFVDEGKESYDVHISIDANNELIKNECECELKKPCLHQVFLADFIAQKKEISAEKVKRKSTKKLPEHHLLIDSLDELKMKEWLKKLMDSSKSVKYEFMLQFKDKSFSPDTIEQNIVEAISSTTNNRRKLDQSQIKNLLHVFDKLNQPIYDSIRESKDLQASILMIIIVFKTTINHYNFIKSNSKRYEDYITNLLPLLTESLIKAPIETYTFAIDLLIQKVKNERSIRASIYNYLFSLRDIVDIKKRLVLMSHLNLIEKSNPYSTSYFSPSIAIKK